MAASIGVPIPMPTSSKAEEPPSLAARPAQGRAVAEVVSIHPQHPDVRAVLDAWSRSVSVLAARPLSALTRQRLEDCHRISEELRAVLSGKEPGEGLPSHRSLRAAIAYGRVQGLCSSFGCPSGAFIELLVAAPWNILGPDDPADHRTVRGAGSALVADIVSWSQRSGRSGRVSLQAENPRTLPFYARLGFRRMRADDHPLLLVPRGPSGWSASILRVARSRPGRNEERSPWLVRDPERIDASANAGLESAPRVAGLQA